VRHYRQAGKIFLRHSDKLVFLPVTDDFYPVVLKQFELDFAFREQANKFNELLCRNGSCAVLLNLCFARRADT
jgi:hypothetical protein